MPSGYEDQQPDPDAEARFQQFINAPRPERDLSPGARLRDAFAILLARGHDQATPVEAFWPSQAAALREPPPPDPTIVRPREMGDSTTTDLPMRAPNPGAAADLAFPTAKAYEDPRLKSSAIPFPGAKEIEVKPYDLPKTGKKNKKNKDKD